MIRTRAQVDTVFRVLVPQVHTLAALPPGTTLVVHGHYAAEPSSVLLRVVTVPDAPGVYPVIVPKGAQVEVYEE